MVRIKKSFIYKRRLHSVVLNNMQYKNIQKNKGFTLLETLIALLLLVMVLNPAFTLMSNSLFGAKYAKNQITADYLLQEVVDSIRNDRDSFVQNNNDWAGFINKYGLIDGGVGKTVKSSCAIETSPYDNVVNCETTTDGSTLSPAILYYDKNNTNGGYYTTKASTPEVEPTIFKREVYLTLLEGDEVDISVVVTWTDGITSRSRTLYSSLLNWQ